MRETNRSRLLGKATAVALGLGVGVGVGLGVAGAGVGPLGIASARADDAPTYRPPLRGAPGGRIGGATRGGAEQLPRLDVIAPETHVGQAATDQPTLYWFVSKPVTLPMQLTLVTDVAPKPVLEVNVPASGKAGMLSLNLADYKVKLVPNAEYEWSIAVVVDPKQRSNDLVSTGVVKLVPPPADIAQKLASAPAAARAAVYAENGYWYDAFDALSQAIQRNPADKRLHEQRAALLDQVALKEAAAYERKAAQ